MKMTKSILALAAAFAVTAGVAQAVTPVTFTLTAYVKPGATIQAISINNAALLQKIGKALNANLAGAKLCVETNGQLVVTTAGGVTLYNLSEGSGSNWVTSITAGVNHSVITNYTEGYAYVDGQFGEAFSFWDPIYTGTQTPFLEPVVRPPGDGEEFIPGSDAFNVKGHAVGGYFWLYIGYQKHQVSSLHPVNIINVGAAVYDNLEVSDGSAATFACSLAAGVYKQSFLINAAGEYNSSLYGGDGVLWGTVSLSGTQTGGETFLDPFNEFGNFGTFYNDD